MSHEQRVPSVAARYGGTAVHSEDSGPEDVMVLRVPELGRRLRPPRLHPATPAVVGQRVPWLRDALADIEFPGGTPEDFLRQDVHHWSVYCLPTARADRIADLSNIHELAFAMDDMLESVHDTDADADVHTASDLDPASGSASNPGSGSGSGFGSGFGRAARRERVEPLARALERALAGLPPTGPVPSYLRAADGCFRTLRETGPAPWYRRFGEAVLSWFHGAVKESSMMATGRLTGFEETLDSRIDTAGGFFIATSIEYGLGIDLTDAIAAGPELGEVERAAWVHGVLVNDLFSYRKEHFGEAGRAPDGRAPDGRANTLRVLADEYACSLQEAVDLLVEHVDAAEARFLELRADVLGAPLGARPGVREYLDALELVLPGNIVWSRTSRRYHGTGCPWTGTARTAMALHPDRTVFTPW
ncbi:terpene synthase family protein [Streptomyces clavuligerus]|uniref:terpene synthase family protein n=1 Tax=Streptomyces clavuligerus TaxID=1901 RepID=UPI00020D948D|nr:terpene synthase family protein [Streptomyces clavuligerus]MBY6306896.1 hypothetical protein [Streptomyces clavuligerus]QPL66967.1 hypothetical protein I3J04_28765 [Streptomyces clavuligerus]QPL72997.1 hypothetical protein I3J05_28815 [Streptomyces clavuligerus]QPL79070.1 hypothetical protein I3J06_28730 [Streptomyces clavuligerus]QPL85101.1 hypothetical protein I3J07_28800 [Streptomyces clavuligerus]